MGKMQFLKIFALAALPLMYSCNSDNSEELLNEEGKELAAETRGDTYYWIGDKKHPLWLITDKSYIMFHVSNQDIVLSKLAAMGLKVDEDIVQELGLVESNFETCTESFYELENYREIRGVNANYMRLYEIPEITYASPYLTGDEHDLLWQFPMTSLLYLYSGDLTKLEEAAKEYGFKIVGKLAMPGYVLWLGTCDKTSKGNALEISNSLIEQNIIHSEPAVPSAIPGAIPPWLLNY